jgi:HEAT repeat protein
MIIIGVLLLGFVVWSAPDLWETARRRSEVAKLQAIIERARQDPGNKAPLQELGAYLDRTNDWDRTQMFAQMRGLEQTVRNKPEAAGFDEVILPLIKTGLTDQSPYVRREAALAARAFGQLAVSSLPELIQVITSHPGENASWFAAEALGNMGPSAKDAIPSLERAVVEGSADLQEAKKKAIDKIRTQPR